MDIRTKGWEEAGRNRRKSSAAFRPGIHPPLSPKTQISEVLRLVDFCIGRYNKRNEFLVRRIVVWIFTRG